MQWQSEPGGRPRPWEGFVPTLLRQITDPNRQMDKPAGNEETYLDESAQVWVRRIEEPWMHDVDIWKKQRPTLPRIRRRDVRSV
jgi:hypothetical protein